jgi:23S rRNA (pseudouridine1915-N3)-methyltransferase
MKLVVLTTHPGQVDWLSRLTEDYAKKLSHFVPFEIILVKTASAARSDREGKKRDDSEALLNKIGEKDFVILCDERGIGLDSVAFSSRLLKAWESGKARVVVVIGGPYGCSPELRKRAQWEWKLSDLVFNHWIAQAVVCEQLFRAITIWKNTPYHND